MDDIFEFLLKNVTNGGTTAVISILIIIIGYLLWERRGLMSSLDKKNDKIDRIINDYYKITVQISGTINSLKMVLLEIKSKL